MVQDSANVTFGKANGQETISLWRAKLGDWSMVAGSVVWYERIEDQSERWESAGLISSERQQHGRPSRPRFIKSGLIHGTSQTNRQVHKKTQRVRRDWSPNSLNAGRATGASTSRLVPPVARAQRHQGTIRKNYRDMEVS